VGIATQAVSANPEKKRAALPLALFFKRMSAVKLTATPTKISNKDRQKITACSFSMQNVRTPRILRNHN
jgi:hypothetical protein